MFVAAAIGIVPAFAQTTNNTREFAFPAIGFGNSEVLEIKVANVASNSSTGTAASCTGNLLFRNAAGATAGSTTAFTLTSGQITSTRLTFTNAGTTGVRATARGMVQVNVPPTTPRPPCSLQITLEIVDAATNATHAVITGGALGTGGR